MFGIKLLSKYLSEVHDSSNVTAGFIELCTHDLQFFWGGCEQHYIIRKIQIMPFLYSCYSLYRATEFAPWINMETLMDLRRELRPDALHVASIDFF